MDQPYEVDILFSFLLEKSQTDVKRENGKQKRGRESGIMNSHIPITQLPRSRTHGLFRFTYTPSNFCSAQIIIYFLNISACITGL